MRKALFSLFGSALAFSLLTSCNSNAIGGGGLKNPPENVPVSLTITDDPPVGVSVLFFQVSLTAASLQPASGTAVSLINNPIPIDVTQLQALSAFLNTANVPTGTYNSLSLTFANPQLVIYNASDTAIAATCAVGTVCQLTPTLDNSATVSITSAPFPVTVAANSPFGFLIDFHLNTIIQSDLSVNLSAANGMTVGQLPPWSPMQPPHFGMLWGTVESASAGNNQFTVLTGDGRSFTVDSNSSTTYADFPCAGPVQTIACVADGQSVQVQVASVQGDGSLLAAQVTYVQASGQQTVVGTIVAIPPYPTPVGETIIQLILHRGPNSNSGLPLGGIAQVAVWEPGSGSSVVTAFSIDSNGFTIPPGLTFATNTDLGIGQTVQVTVAPGTLQESSGPGGNQGGGGWGPPAQVSFTASAIALEPSQITGSVASIGTGSFTLGIFPNTFGPISPTFQAQAVVQTSTQTVYQGFTPDDFSALAVGDVVSVNGWLFPQNGALDPAIGPPIVVAQTVAMHSDGTF
jgi:hypothetical protein